MASKQFKKFTIPKTVSIQEKIEDQPTVPRVYQEPQLAVIQENPAPIQEEVNTGPVIELVKPNTNLLVSEQTFTLLTQFVNQVRTKVFVRAQHTKLHDIIANRLNQGTSSYVARLPETPPSLPREILHSSTFLASYQAEARLASRRLAQLLATEHSNQVTTLNGEIKALITEGEEALFLIINEDEQAKALRLFRLKAEALYRQGSTTTAPRRRVSVKRRHPRKK
jgi:hypothetical protein